MKKLSAKKTAALVIGAAMCAAGLAAWIYQLVQGMQVTNLRNSFTWGLYMGSFEFFIAMATGGILAFSIAYLWNIETLKPFAKIASIGSLASVVAAGVAIFEDLGEPFHALYMIITPNVGSPLFWDVVILTLYVIVCLVAVVLTLLPDTKKHVHDRGYRMTNEENCRRFSFIAFPMAFLLNIITSFMFATQNTREWWHSALIPVNACAEATAVGLSFTILLCVLMVSHEIFVENSDGIRLLSRIAAASIAAYIVMSFIEIVPLAWSGTQESRHLLHLIFHTYGLLFWLEILLPLLAMILFLVGGGLGKELVSVAGILVIVGIFIQRMMLLLPAFNSIPLTLPVAGKLWTFPIAVGTFTEGEDVFVRFWNYVPTAVEWIVGILPVGLIVFVMATAAILFRLNPGEE